VSGRVTCNNTVTLSISRRIAAAETFSCIQYQCARNRRGFPFQKFIFP
jgi:hypothetical protein